MFVYVCVYVYVSVHVCCSFHFVIPALCAIMSFLFFSVTKRWDMQCYQSVSVKNLRIHTCKCLLTYVCTCFVFGMRGACPWASAQDALSNLIAGRSASSGRLFPSESLYTRGNLCSFWGANRVLCMGYDNRDSM